MHEKLDQLVGPQINRRGVSGRCVLLSLLPKLGLQLRSRDRHKQIAKLFECRVIGQAWANGSATRGLHRLAGDPARADNDIRYLLSTNAPRVALVVVRMLREEQVRRETCP